MPYISTSEDILKLIETITSDKEYLEKLGIDALELAKIKLDYHRIALMIEG